MLLNLIHVLCNVALFSPVAKSLQQAAESIDELTLPNFVGAQLSNIGVDIDKNTDLQTKAVENHLSIAVFQDAWANNVFASFLQLTMSQRLLTVMLRMVRIFGRS